MMLKQMLSPREALLVCRGLERQRNTMMKWIARGSMSTRNRDDSDESTIASWNSDVGIINRLLEELGA